MEDEDDVDNPDIAVDIWKVDQLDGRLAPFKEFDKEAKGKAAEVEEAEAQGEAAEVESQGKGKRQKTKKSVRKSKKQKTK